LLDRLAEGVDPLLPVPQRKRFKQILLQQQGPDALLMPELIRALSLSERQITQLRAVLDDTRIRLDAIARTPWKDKGPAQRQRESYEVRSREQKLVLAVLTDEQRQTWIDLRGRRFDFNRIQPMSVRAPELRDAGKAEAWVNSAPLTLAELRGQVAVVHFWTFGCGNCRHNYWAYKGWQRDYGPRGVVMIGVHTPETKEEHDLARLRQSVKDNGLTFPILIDNDRKNWDAWSNCVWPSVYAIDRRGYVRNWWYGELKGSQPDQDNEKLVRARLDVLLAEPAAASRPGK
jgi:peroxiredoxin